MLLAGNMWLDVADEALQGWQLAPRMAPILAIMGP